MDEVCVVCATVDRGYIDKGIHERNDNNNGLPDELQ